MPIVDLASEGVRTKTSGLYLDWETGAYVGGNGVAAGWDDGTSLSTPPDLAYTGSSSLNMCNDGTGFPWAYLPFTGGGGVWRLRMIAPDSDMVYGEETYTGSSVTAGWIFVETYVYMRLDFEHEFPYDWTPGGANDLENFYDSNLFMVWLEHADTNQIVAGSTAYEERFPTPAAEEVVTTWPGQCGATIDADGWNYAGASNWDWATAPDFTFTPSSLDAVANDDFYLYFACKKKDGGADGGTYIITMETAENEAVRYLEYPRPATIVPENEDCSTTVEEGLSIPEPGYFTYAPAEVTGGNPSGIATPFHPITTPYFGDLTAPFYLPKQETIDADTIAGIVFAILEPLPAGQIGILDFSITGDVVGSGIGARMNDSGGNHLSPMLVLHEIDTTTETPEIFEGPVRYVTHDPYWESGTMAMFTQTAGSERWAWAFNGTEATANDLGLTLMINTNSIIQNPWSGATVDRLFWLVCDEELKILRWFPRDDDLGSNLNSRGRSVNSWAGGAHPTSFQRTQKDGRVGGHGYF